MKITIEENKIIGTLRELINEESIKLAIEFTTDRFLSNVKNISDYDSIIESVSNLIFEDFKKSFFGE